MILTLPFDLRYDLISPHLTFSSYPKFSERNSMIFQGYKVNGSKKWLRTISEKDWDVVEHPFRLSRKRQTMRNTLFSTTHISHLDRTGKGMLSYRLNKRNQMITIYALIWRVRWALELFVIAETWGFCQSRGKLLKIIFTIFLSL